MKSFYRLQILVAIFALSICFVARAQSPVSETQDQRESANADRLERPLQAPKLKTADEILDMLKARAKAKLEKRRIELLRKIKLSAGIGHGIESNPSNDSLNKGDSFSTEDFSFSWAPTFSQKLSADIGYTFSGQNYYEQKSLNTETHISNASFKIYPFDSGRVILEPGFNYTWTVYPLAYSSSFEEPKEFIKFTHYIAKMWSYGGKYEFSHKHYNKTAARDLSGNDLDLDREDDKNSVELWHKTYIGRYTMKLKVKGSTVTSNDQYQKYQDYDSLRYFVTFSRTFLKDDKLYVSFTPDYESKGYNHRVASETNTARWDKIWNYQLDAYYTLTKNVSLSYGFTYRHSASNATSGDFSDFTNKIGISYSF